MQSNKFTGIAKKIAEKDKQVFDNLMDFERTKKIRTKARMDFTIDKAVSSDFKKYCRDNGYNMSAKIEQAMRKILEDKN